MAQAKVVTPFRPGKKSGDVSPPAGPPPQDPPSGPPPEWADPEGCNVTPLGHRGGIYYFLTPSGEFRHLSDRGMTTTGLLSLFDGETAWLAENFPAMGRDSKSSIGFDNQRAAGYLIRQCVRHGLFNPDVPMRGPGVWRTGTGDLVVHAGDALNVPASPTFDGSANGVRQWVKSGQRIDGVLYPAWPPLERPASVPADVTMGLRLLDLARLWNFRTPNGADLAIGWIGAAMLGGAPNWRAHVYLTGENGTGKTWFSEFVSASLGAGAHPSSNDATEAGLRQWLTGEARAIILDESEHDEVKGRIHQVIELLRNISSGKGSRSARGASNGSHAQLFSVTGCAFLSSVLHAPLKPQDRARFTLIHLAQLPAHNKAGRQADAARAAIAEAETLSPALRARAIARWGFYQEAFKLYRTKFLALGCTPRAADQISTLLAGRDLLCADELPDSDSLHDTTIQFADLVEAAAQNEEEGEGHQCLSKLYTSPADLWRSGERWTIGEIVEKAIAKETDHLGLWLGRSLAKLGLRLEYLDNLEPVLLVANNHESLTRVFKDSRWAGGAWSQALRMLDGASAWGAPVRFTGPQQRCTALPKRWLPVPEPKTEPPGSVKGEEMPTPIP